MGKTLSFIGFLMLCFVLNIVHSQDDYCYYYDPEPSFRHSLYASYFPLENTNDDSIEFENCNARSFWVYNRHGARNPQDYELVDDVVMIPQIQQQVLDNHAQDRGQLCQEDLDLIASWTQDVQPDQEGDLMGSGYVEMEEMGRRYRNRLPELLQQPYDPDKTIVRTTDYERTEHSLKAYMAGIFAQGPGNFEIPDPVDPDPFLRFPDFCDKYVEEVKNNPDSGLEQELFISDAQEMLDTRANVSIRLGYPEDEILSYEAVYAIFDACRLDRARKPNTPSPWCAAFQDEQLAVFEYTADLKVWWVASYGYHINTEFACLWIKDMVDNFSLEDELMPTSIIYSGHSTELSLTFTTMGLFYDELPLMHDNYADQQDREFKTTKQLLFAGNMEFILFYCDEGEAEPVRRILFQYNERTMTLPGCSEELCLLDEFVSNNQDLATCPFDEICENQQTF